MGVAVVADTAWVAKKNEPVLSRMAGSSPSLDHFAQSKWRVKGPGTGPHWDVVVSVAGDHEGPGIWDGVD